MPFIPKYIVSPIAPLPTATLEASKNKRNEEDIKELIRKNNELTSALAELQKYVADSGI